MGVSCSVSSIWTFAPTRLTMDLVKDQYLMIPVLPDGNLDYRGSVSAYFNWMLPSTSNEALNSFTGYMEFHRPLTESERASQTSVEVLCAHFGGLAHGHYLGHAGRTAYGPWPPFVFPDRYYEVYGSFELPQPFARLCSIARSYGKRQLILELLRATIHYRIHIGHFWSGPRAALAMSAPMTQGGSTRIPQSGGLPVSSLLPTPIASTTTTQASQPSAQVFQRPPVNLVETPSQETPTTSTATTPVELLLRDEVVAPGPASQAESDVIPWEQIQTPSPILVDEAFTRSVGVETDPTLTGTTTTTLGVNTDSEITGLHLHSSVPGIHVDKETQTIAGQDKFPPFGYAPIRMVRTYSRIDRKRPFPKVDPEVASCFSANLELLRKLPASPLEPVPSRGQGEKQKKWPSTVTSDSASADSRPDLLQSMGSRFERALSCHSESPSAAGFNSGEAEVGQPVHSSTPVSAESRDLATQVDPYYPNFDETYNPMSYAHFRKDSAK